jgi:hypothetical protein
MKPKLIFFTLSTLLIYLVTPVVKGDSFTLTPPSPTLPTIPALPADILYDVGAPPPDIGIPFAALGLDPGDVVDAISDGLDPVPFPHTDYFSVTPGSMGLPGTGVALEVAADTPPGLTPGHASDIFVTSPPLAGTNILAPAGFGWTLGTTTGDEANTGLINPGDNVNSYDLTTMPPPAPGGPIVFFSLAPGSPSLVTFAATPDDVLAVGGPFGPAPVIFLDGVAALGLPPGTDLDALALLAPGGAFVGPGGIEYSLTAATAGLVPASLGSGATILGLGAGPVPITVHTPPALGLLPEDDLDALDVDQQIIVPEPANISLLALGAMVLMMIRRRKSG